MRSDKKGKENIYTGLAYKNQKLIWVLNGKLKIKTRITLCHNVKPQRGGWAESGYKDIDLISM